MPKAAMTTPAATVQVAPSWANMMTPRSWRRRSGRWSDALRSVRSPTAAKSSGDGDPAADARGSACVKREQQVGTRQHDPSIGRDVEGVRRPIGGRGDEGNASLVVVDPVRDG